MIYEPRSYRAMHSQADLYRFQASFQETDLDIAITKGKYTEELYVQVSTLIAEMRLALDEYIRLDPVFKTALIPHKPMNGAPAAVVEMCRASLLAGVGPMAAVAGLFSEKVGVLLNKYAGDVIVENGGDIWLKSVKKRKVAVYAGKSPFSMQIGLEIEPHDTPLGICTSSGTVGHSLSFGQADAVIILAPSAVLADAAATASANLVQEEGDLEKAVNFALGINGIKGALAIKGDKMAARGRIKLIPMNK